MYTDYQGYGDWDFRGEDTKQYTHCFHIYPAMMIPQVARGLIQLYGKKGDLLFDPYCGSGTSLVEGRLEGMSVCGTDLNPTARLIAKAKSIDYNTETLRMDIQNFLKNLEIELLNVSSLDQYSPPEFVTFDRLKDWFPEKSIAEVSFCLQKISKIKSEDNKNFILIALSECLRLISFQRNREFKLYRIKSEDRESHYVELLPLLEKRLDRNLSGIISFQEKTSDDTSDVGVYSFNTVETNGSDILPKFADIVVTSPPYGDSGTTVAYAQFSWLSNVWLGLDGSPAGALDRKLMGGRREEITPFGFKPMDDAIEKIYLENEKRAKEVMHFYDEYYSSIKNVSSIVKEGGIVCYVVGNRTVKGIQLPTDQFTAWAFEQFDFEYQTTYLRDIPNKRMPSKNSPTNVAGKKVSTMHHEYLVVLKKKVNRKPNLSYVQTKLVQDNLEWEDLREPLDDLIKITGTGETLDLATYNLISDNLTLIPEKEKKRYHKRVIEHLLSLVGKPIKNTANLHPGDHLEEIILGIPRKNNNKIGDLLGLELKTFTGKSPLTLTSFSCVEDLVKLLKISSQAKANMWDIVWFPTHVNHHGKEPTNTHHLRANENLIHAQPNKLGKVTLDAMLETMDWKLISNGSTFKYDTHHNVFTKYQEGILMLEIVGTKSSDEYTILEIYYDKTFTPSGIAEHYRNGKIKFEIRYDLPDKDENRISHCKTPRNSGHAFRMTVGTVRKTIMNESNKIKSIEDFRY